VLAFEVVRLGFDFDMTVVYNNYNIRNRFAKYEKQFSLNDDDIIMKSCLETKFNFLQPSNRKCEIKFYARNIYIKVYILYDDEIS